MRVRRGSDKLSIASGRRRFGSQRQPYVDCLPDVCTWAMFIRGDAHSASDGEP